MWLYLTYVTNLIRVGTDFIVNCCELRGAITNRAENAADWKQTSRTIIKTFNRMPIEMRMVAFHTTQSKNLGVSERAFDKFINSNVTKLSKRSI